jgi:integrase
MSGKPLVPREVQIIRQILENAGHLRDLDLFSVGIDTMLRGVDLLALKLEDTQTMKARLSRRSPSASKRPAKQRL